MDSAHSAPPQLSWPSFLVCLGASVALFLRFNPIWEAVEIGALDRGIWWSYGILPLLAAACLALERKLTLVSMFLETFKLVLFKFVLTYALASLGWILQGPPLAAGHDRQAYAVPGNQELFAPGPVPAPTPLDPTRTGSLSGRVLDAEGAAVVGALVYVRSGLAAQRFPVPSDELTILCGEDGNRPRLSVLRAHQTLVLRSVDSALHTVQLSDSEGHSILNHPCTPGSLRRLMFDHDLGLLSLGCRVHGAKEESAMLLVTSNPFHAYSDAEGGFRFDGVPAGSLELAAWSPLHGSSSLDLLLEGMGQLSGAELRFRPASKAGN